MAISSPTVRTDQRRNPILDALDTAAKVVQNQKAMAVEQERLQVLKDQTQAAKNATMAETFMGFMGDLSASMGAGGSQITARLFKESIISMMGNLGMDPNDVRSGLEMMIERGIDLDPEDWSKFNFNEAVNGRVTFAQFVDETSTGMAGRQQRADAAQSFSAGGDEERTAVAPAARPTAETPVPVGGATMMAPTEEELVSDLAPEVDLVIQNPEAFTADIPTSDTIQLESGVSTPMSRIDLDATARELDRIRRGASDDPDIPAHLRGIMQAGAHQAFQAMKDRGLAQ